MAHKKRTTPDPLHYLDDPDIFDIGWNPWTDGPGTDPIAWLEGEDND